MTPPPPPLNGSRHTPPTTTAATEREHGPEFALLEVLELLELLEVGCRVGRVSRSRVVPRGGGLLEGTRGRLEGDSRGTRGGGEVCSSRGGGAGSRSTLRSKARSRGGWGVGAGEFRGVLRSRWSSRSNSTLLEVECRGWWWCSSRAARRGVESRGRLLEVEGASSRCAAVLEVGNLALHRVLRAARVCRVV